MRKTLLHLPILLLFVFSSLGTQAGTLITDSIYSGGVYRHYMLYVPSTYNASNNVPLLFNNHGYTSSNIAQYLYTNFQAIADTANFIIVLPQGLKVPPLNQTGWNTFGNVADAITDINFVDNLIDTIRNSYSIDTNRIYSTGMSNGGYFSYTLACQLSHRIAAIASVTGAMRQNHWDSCNATHPTPVMQISGTNDPVINYNGGSPPYGSIATETTIANWVGFNNCDATPTVSNLPDINTADSSTVEHYVYSNGAGGVTVELYKVLNGGHEWPSGAGANLGNGHRNMDFNATKEIWRFFSQRTLVADIAEIEKNNEVSVFPNPNKGSFTITVDDYTNARLDVYNALGVKVYSSLLTDYSSVIALDNATTGAYFYQVVQGDTIVKSGKLIVE